jgi:2-keto-3-deoxy-L-rhamnonate aldolase RhmA
VGPADLALSHGLSVGKPSAEVDALLRRIYEACVRHGKIPAIHTTSGADCREKIAIGYGMCSIGSDSVWLHAAYTAEVAKARDEVAISAGGLY